MIQADRVLSTPPTNTSATTPQSSRRGFLVQAAGVAAAGAALGAALPLPASSSVTAQSYVTEADPIFAAIVAHRTALEQLNRDCSALAEAADDDEVSQQKLDALHDLVGQAEDGLLDVVPTTMAGVLAILTYAADHVRRGAHWATGYVDNEPLSGWCKTHGVPWEVILHQNLAAALYSINI
jgi:hypothetical protein